MRDDGKDSALPRLLSLKEVARLTGLSVVTLADAGWRRRAGLKVTRIGGRRIAGVAPEDLRAILRRDGDAQEPA
jgi:hypothetical protein